jgi:hypothetical protein
VETRQQQKEKQQIRESWHIIKRAQNVLEELEGNIRKANSTQLKFLVIAVNKLFPWMRRLPYAPKADVHIALDRLSRYKRTKYWKKQLRDAKPPD